MGWRVYGLGCGWGAVEFRVWGKGFGRVWYGQMYASEAWWCLKTKGSALLRLASLSRSLPEAYSVKFDNGTDSATQGNDLRFGCGQMYASKA